MGIRRTIRGSRIAPPREPQPTAGPRLHGLRWGLPVAQYSLQPGETISPGSLELDYAQAEP